MFKIAYFTKKIQKISLNLLWTQMEMYGAAHSTKSNIFISNSKKNSFYKVMDSIEGAFNSVMQIFDTELRTATETNATNIEDQTGDEWMSGEGSSLKYLQIDPLATNMSDTDLNDRFEAEWPAKKPVVVKQVHKQLDGELWTPAAFEAKFGNVKVDLIDCQSGHEYKDACMATFWQAYIYFYTF